MDDIETLITELSTLRTRLELIEQQLLGANNAAPQNGPNVGMVPVGQVPQTVSVPDNFEPVFDDDGKLSEVHWGFYPIGRKFILGGTNVEESAKVAKGFIGMEVTHPVGTEGYSMKIVLISENFVSVLNSSLDKTVIPLYYIENGKIAHDFRSVASLPIRE